MTAEEAIKQLKEYILGMNYMDDEAVWMAINALEPQPCEDCVSRKEVIDIINFEDKWLFDAKSHNADTEIAFSAIKTKISKMPPVTPKFTDAEIQKMQELEQAQLDKAYELGKTEIRPCEDCINRKEVNVLVDELARAISDERCFMSRGRSTANIMQDILDLPSVQPIRPTGKWIDSYRQVVYRCSECNALFAISDMDDYSFCPNCGARMEV